MYNQRSTNNEYNKTQRHPDTNDIHRHDKLLRSSRIHRCIININRTIHYRTPHKHDNNPTRFNVGIGCNLLHPSSTHRYSNRKIFSQQITNINNPNPFTALSTIKPQQAI